jgi:simple sugar transport system substrate-binding protein
MVRKVALLVAVLTVLGMALPYSRSTAWSAEEPFVFGMLLVGPYNDRGWSQAHYEGGRAVEQVIAGSKMIYIDKVNPADRPGVTIPQLVDDMVEKGASLIFATSDDMKDGTREAAMLHPEIKFVHVSGDDVLTGKAPANLSNVMGRMEYGKMIAGFSAAMTSRTGKIAYLGPLINEETRRLAACCYLGARYAWEKVRGKAPEDLSFQVTWIGFWFNIPGVTADPTQVAQNFFNTGVDVVVSGIDTTEALVVAGQKHKEGKSVWAIPYDYEGACEGADAVCLGVPYFNWRPSYLDFVNRVRQNRWESVWLWTDPNWADLNNPETSHVGFEPGPALSGDARKAVETFIADLGAGRINLFAGPLNYQDGTPFVQAGQVASDRQIWYMEQLLEGMVGQSSAK